jgi:hypothetical protein
VQPENAMEMIKKKLRRKNLRLRKENVEPENVVVHSYHL